MGCLRVGSPKEFNLNRRTHESSTRSEPSHHHWLPPVTSLDEKSKLGAARHEKGAASSSSSIFGGDQMRMPSPSRMDHRPLFPHRYPFINARPRKVRKHNGVTDLLPFIEGSIHKVRTNPRRGVMENQYAVGEIA